MEINLTAYLLFMGCGAAAGILWFFLDSRKRMPAGRAAALAALTLLLGALLGLAGARLVWFLCRINTRPVLFALAYDEMSYYGGVAGVTLAVWLAAKLLGLNGRETLNAFAPMGALMAAAARFADGFLGMLGVGAWMENGIFFPVTVEHVYDETYSEFYLAVFMFEGLFSLIAMFLSLRRRDEPDRFLRTVFYLCLPQIFCESLRAQSIKWLFVRSEQLFCFLFCEGTLVWYGIRKKAGSFPRRFGAALAGLAVCGLIIAAEFALDGKILVAEQTIPQWITYIFVLLGLGCMAVCEHRARR